MSIAIDGPAGAGKSTIAKIVSEDLDTLYLDTGAMYRAVALKALREKIDTKDKDRITQLMDRIEIKVMYFEKTQKVFLDGEDVSGKIRTPEVSKGASDVSAIHAVRIKMVELQREIAKEESVIMDGRDIGTYVLPNAEFKFFLTASVEERSKRRYREQLEKGVEGITLEDVRKDIEYRDKNDSSRDLAPLKKASDAVEVDTTKMTIPEVADKILSIVKGNIYS